MTLRGRIVGAVAGGLGLAAAGTAYGVAHQSRVIDRRVAPSTALHDPRRQVAVDLDDEPGTAPLGSLRSAPITVVASDGVPLHVEVDEVLPDVPPLSSLTSAGGRRRRWGRPAEPGLTVVFVHGYCLTLDCWHFQRAAYRGRVRTVFYDQRSHGRSGRSSRENSTIEQLAEDLRSVLDTVAPEGPVLLVGHSMGGMSVIAFAELHPELLADRVVGVALVATTAGGLDPGRILLPLVPAKLSGELTGTAVRTLHRGHRAVDGLRRVGKMIAIVGTDLLAFGGEVPAAYVQFADRMLAATPFEVVGDFFPSFRGLDKFDAVEVLGRIPVTIMCGTSDRLTSIGHSRKLHSRIPGATLVELDGAGHLVLLERHDEVTAEIDRLVARAARRRAS